MATPIPEAEVTRLSRLAGVANFDDWQAQLENVDDRISDQLQGSIADAWQACLPTWIAFGRVKDLARGVRVPKYWPSYANRLGRAFAEAYRTDYDFLISVLATMSDHSYEYLCAYDVLEQIASDLYADGDSIPGKIRDIALPIPPVVRLETESDHNDDGLATVGEAIYRSCLIEWGDEEDDT